MDQDYAAYAESEADLLDIAEQLAYDNFSDFDCATDVAEEMGYDIDEMTDEDWDEVNEHIEQGGYYSAEIYSGEDDEYFDDYELMYDARLQD